MHDPKKCSMLDCDNPLGPNALEFTHKGEPAGGICDLCLEEEPVIRVLFKLNKEGIYEAEEMTHIKESM